MWNHLIKTKTLKLNSSPYNKVKMKLKVIQIEFDFYIDKKSEPKIICMLGLGDNKKYLSSLLGNRYKLSNQDIDTIMNYLSTIYKLDLSKVLEN